MLLSQFLRDDNMAIFQRKKTQVDPSTQLYTPAKPYTPAVQSQQPVVQKTEIYGGSSPTQSKPQYSSSQTQQYQSKELPQVLASRTNQVTTPPTTQTPPPTKTVSPASTYISELQKINKENENSSLTLANKQKLAQTGIFDRRNKFLSDQIPQTEESIRLANEEEAKNIAAQEEARRMSTEEINNLAGEEMKNNAIARKEGESRNMAKFSALNTIDSAGAGSYRESQINNENDYQREVGAIGARKTKDIILKNREIDTEIGKVKAYARSQKQAAESKKAEIMANIDMNDQEKQSTIASIDQQLADKLSQAKEYVSKIRYDNAATAQGKTLTASELSNLSDYDNGIAQLDTLSSLTKSGVFNPLTSGLRARNPYDTEFQNAQAKIKAVAQVIGKAMEGGVLRKEDIPKYEAILPNPGDTAEVATVKIENVKKMLATQRDIQRKGFQDAGYNAGQPAQVTTNTSSGNDRLGLGI